MSPYDILDWIYYLFFLTILVPMLIAFRNWSHMPMSMRWTGWLLVALTLIELLSLGLRFNQIRNHFIYYLQTWAIVWFGAAIYAPRFGRQVCYTMAILISVLVILEVKYLVGFNYINSATLTLARIMLALSAFSTLKQLISAEPTKPLWDQAAIFLNAGLLIFGFFSLITSAFKSHFIESSLNFYYFFDTLAVITNAIAFLIMARGFYLAGLGRFASFDH